MNKFHLAYSKEIDKEFFDTALAGRNEGCLSVDNSLLRQLLLVTLAKNGFMGILRENGGKYTFGDFWAQRLFERHDMVLRVCTSKMREQPAEFVDKKNNYLKVVRDYIFKYRTPAVM